MRNAAETLIDALGGTTAVSRLTDAPLSTVHSWRKNGIPRSRLSHLKLAVRVAKLPVEIEALAQGVTPDAIKPAQAAA